MVARGDHVLGFSEIIEGENEFFVAWQLAALVLDTYLYIYVYNIPPVVYEHKTICMYISI